MLPHNREAIGEYLQEQPDVVAAYLFGSVARAQATAQSDLDIAVLLANASNPEESLERQIRLTSDLARFSGREVQVTILNRAPPLLAFQVIRDRQLLCERSRAERITFEVNTMKRYFDIKPMLDFHSEHLHKRIREVGLGRRSKRTERAIEAAERIRERLARATDR